MTKKLPSQYRQRARDHLAAAERLLRSGDDDVTRYACIELRLCVEAICYGMLCLYRSELSKGELAKWQPKKVLDELLEIDKYATTPQLLSVQDPKTGEWHDFGTQDYRFSVKWANKAHNALGNALHVPTIDQVEKGQEATPAIFRERCQEYMPELRKVLDSQSWHLHMTGPRWTMRCACGFEMHRRAEHIEKGVIVICSECGRVYDVVHVGDVLDIELRKLRWQCKKCGKENGTPERDLVENIMTECFACGEPTQVRKQWMAYQQEPNGTDA
ncbi:hypothetical protein FJ970_02745 [Mesorhizobium sp. B2-1-8]|uniref:hypothetical protein n=1 Tax=Mesorhizobium sp. B2-1-8 TaxID=2589967 RepID=UPI001129822C|nr:hypothetical protein [Mesorhizobium sp. B2-1-8]UCI19907.1 hypothetical protein FJ970_02745 [Mesorhizobium sp. B2-1-8]